MVGKAFLKNKDHCLPTVAGHGTEPKPILFETNMGNKFPLLSLDGWMSSQEQT